MDNQMLGLIGIGVVAYLVLKNKEQETVEPVTPPTPPTPPPTPVVGCMNPNATNYNPAATVNDNNSCQFPVVQTPIIGCMDATALNYDPSANIDSGACTYSTPIVYGCTDPIADNYDPLATDDNATCSYTEVDCWSGCPTPTLVPSVQTVCPATHPNLSEPSCVIPVMGCQDALASNYNPNATQGCS